MTTNGTEVLGDLPNRPTERPLPNGWMWTTIGEITEPIEKVKPQDEPEKEFTYLDISGIDNKRNVVAEPKVYYGADAPSRARQSVKVGDVLFSTVRTYLKNIAQVPEIYDGQVASTGFSILRGEERISNEYLFYYSLTDMFLTPLGALQRGSSYPAVRDGDVREQPIPLAPFLEQERIVAEIEKQFTRLDQAVASLRRLQSNLARHKASVLKAGCEGRLVPQDPNDEPATELLTRILAERRAQWETAEWQKLIVKAQKKVAQAGRKAQGRPARIKDLQPGEWETMPEADYGRYLPKGNKWKEKYKEPGGVDTAVLPDLPEGWVWVTWQQVGLSQNGRAFPSKQYQSSGFKLLRPGNLHKSGKIEWTEKNTRYMPISWSEEYPTYIIHGRELVINLTAQSLKDEFLGRVCITSQNDECLLNQRIARLTPIFISSEYLLWMFKSQVFRTFVKGLNTGSLIQHMFTSQLDEFAFPLPPLAEQKRIVAEVERRLSVVAATEQAIAANLSRAERLRQSILGRAFTGQLIRRVI